ncbi:DMT family transporter [Aeromonas rivipollensis]
MTTLILLGLLNGVAVSLSRTLNGRLASARGAMTASLANHLLGFGLLGALLILKGAPWERLAGLDPWLLLGGVLGALFVAISSWAIGRVGALACALLIVTGQLAGAHCSMPWPDGWPRVICSALCWCWPAPHCNAGRPASHAPRHERR